MNNISIWQDITQFTGAGTGASGLSTRSAQLSDVIKQAIAFGTAAYQINTWYDADRALAGGTWTVTISGSPTGGTFTISVTTGGNYLSGVLQPVVTTTTAAIAYNAIASTVQTDLQALSNGTGITVSGSAGGPYTITIPAALSPASITASGTALTGGSSPAATATNAQIPIVGTAPTFGSPSTTGGALHGNTTIYAVYSYYNSNGETIASSEGSYSVPAGTNTNEITLTAPSLPSGATGVNVYVGNTSGQESYVGQNAANTYLITTLPSAGARLPSLWNTTVLTSETINLASLTDPLGNALTFKGISCIHIENPSTINPLFVWGSSATFAGPQSSPSNVYVIPPASVINGIIIPTVLHAPAYAQAGGTWKVFSGVNNLLQVGTTDPNGVVYGIALPGVQ